MRNSLSRDDRTTREANAKRNMLNRKPYRTAEQRKDARAGAEKRNGTCVARSAPVSFHTKRQDNSK